MTYVWHLICFWVGVNVTLLALDLYAVKHPRPRLSFDHTITVVPYCAPVPSSPKTIKQQGRLAWL